MSDLKVCRICLRAQCKVYNINRFHLRAYYEEVLAEKVKETDELPQYFCYECATILHKFHKFKEKCWMGQKVLKQIQTSKGHISYEEVHQIDRDQYKLKSPLQIITVSNKVKSYVTTESTLTVDTELEKTCKNEDIINIQDNVNDEEIYCNEGATSDDYDSDNPLEDIKDDIAIEEHQLPIETKETQYNLEVIVKDIKDEQNEPDSPKTVFIDEKKDVIELKCEKIKERRKSFTEYGLKKINPRFAKPKRVYPDAEIWKKYTLSEEEAVKQFQLKAEDAKYKKAAYKCVDCFKGFSNQEILKRHKLLRHSPSQGRLECWFCHKRFKWDSKLRKHMNEHFTRYKCLQCGIEVCVENTALLHEDNHKGNIKKCEHCGEEFRHRSTYYTHLRTHRSKYLCTLCGMSFVSPSGLQMHKKIKHVNDEIESPDDDEPVNTYCDKCDVRFETRKAFDEHLFHSTLHVDDGSAEACDEYGVPRKILSKKTKDRIKESLKKNVDEEAQEEVRPKKGRRSVRRKLQKKPTTCNQCGKHFDTQAACMKHHQAEHPRTSFFNERHICEICGASLAPGSVAMHQNIHSRQNEFPCSTCGRKFHSKMGLKRHTVTHTGEKPFGCSLCDKRFTQSNSMKLHYRTFHLKQPYPKRNRRKKKDDAPSVPAAGEQTTDESDASVPAPAIEPTNHDRQETMHYLTLS